MGSAFCSNAAACVAMRITQHCSFAGSQLRNEGQHTGLSVDKCICGASQRHAGDGSRHEASGSSSIEGAHKTTRNKRTQGALLPQPAPACNAQPLPATCTCTYTHATCTLAESATWLALSSVRPANGRAVPGAARRHAAPFGVRAHAPLAHETLRACAACSTAWESWHMTRRMCT